MEDGLEAGRSIMQEKGGMRSGSGEGRGGIAYQVPTISFSPSYTCKPYTVLGSKLDI